MFAQFYREQEKRLKNNLKKSLNMNLTKIRILLEKFYDGESTLEEENQLIIFFSSEDIPESLESDKKLFLSMKCKDSDIKVPDDLNDNISDFID